MTDLGNQLDDDGDRVSQILGQPEIDAMNMKELNQANRYYRKCLAGKCPPVVDRRAKKSLRKIPKNFISKRIQDKKLSIIWVESGRDRRCRIMEDELMELDKKIKVAKGKTHRTVHENNFKAIERAIKDIEEMNVQITKAKSEITHIKSQIDRVAQKKTELSRETESEDQFQTHFKKANRQLEIYEGRVQTSRQHECLMTSQNYKLRKLIKDMLFDRTLFNFYWNKIVNNLRDRRKFLLDMIERSNQAFNQGADFLDNLKKLQSRRAADREFHISEMINMERKIDANQIINLFLGGKGKKRVMAPLEAREIRRRDDFKSEYSERLNLYSGVIENIKKLTGVPDIKIAVDYYMRQENEGFQFYTYLNEMNHQIEYLTSNYSKYSMEVWTSQDYYSRKLKYFEQRVDDLHKQLHDEINKTLALKDDREKYDSNIAMYLDTILETLKIFKCDLSSVEKLLADHKRVTVFNMQTFLTLLENRMNEILAYVYCDQRKNSADIIADDAKLTVKSLKRAQEERLDIEDVITTQQCAECAEGEDVNRYDEKTVYPLDHEAIEEIMREKVKAPGMTFRLHNLSKCNLPRSGVIMGRRYAE